LPKFLINWQNQLITLLNYPALTIYNICEDDLLKETQNTDKRYVDCLVVSNLDKIRW